MLPAFLFSLTSLDDATSMHDYVVVNNGDMQEFILPEEPVDVKKRHQRVISTTSPTHAMSPHEFSPISSTASSAASFEFLSPLSTVYSQTQQFPPGVTSFCPATHPAESFTEDYRLQIPLHQNPYLTVLEKISPEQFTRCLELLRTSLPIELNVVRDVMPKPNGFVHTVLEAYNNHCGLILRPDDVWIVILTQFSFFVSANTEQLRSHFVAHEGQEELDISIYTVYFCFCNALQ
ncbi:hypothetical protein DEU56DRAFT_916837 [Suillus clintonianus]|uniref:uncharacterized protein n=1 Tax=Suillus clintonianus TaxID=1904413 RepID=UPI001B87680C|nr:uncharacterized protein DEU56DRAFT_916837 [Suillus clintonianus]KAG2124897.1 hypothetical protein DEU56DRAFT_916837 [Suillus clintonianus]